MIDIKTEVKRLSEFKWYWRAKKNPYGYEIFCIHPLESKQPDKLYGPFNSLTEIVEDIKESLV